MAVIDMGRVAGSRNRSGCKLGYLAMAAGASKVQLANRLASRHTRGEGGRALAS